MARSEVDYLVASSEYYDHYFESPEKFPREYAEYMRIFEQSRELVRFTAVDGHARTRAAHLQGDLPDDPAVRARGRGSARRPLGVRCAVVAARLSSCARGRSRGARSSSSSPVTRPVCRRSSIVTAVAAIALAVERARHSRRRTALVFAWLFAIGLAFQLQLGARLQSDGFYYFAYLRSLAFDRDVDFTNDYKLLGLGDKPHLFQPTPTGYAQSAATIGPAILWAPFFAAGARDRRSGSRPTNPDVDANGISFPYRQAVCVAGLFYGLIGCWFCFRLTALFFDARLAAARDDARRPGIVHALVPGQGTEHDARAVDGGGRRLRLGLGRDARRPHDAAVGVARRDRRLHDADPLAERALRAAAGVRRDRRCSWPPRGRRIGGV